MSNYKSIPRKSLYQSDRWLINSFLSNDLEINSFVDTDFMSLGDVLRERKESIDPQEFQDTLFNYLGLENIQSYTGFLVDFKPKVGSEIKSRCKVFKSGDLLYSKLRPTLNKVIVIDEKLSDGISSTEFLVFEIDKNRIEPILLRFIIASDFVQEQVNQFIAGAALPRIQTEDFLSIKIPIIEREFQLKLSKYLTEKHDEYLNYFNKLNSYRNDLNKSLLNSILDKKVVENA